MKFLITSYEVMCDNAPVETVKIKWDAQEELTYMQKYKFKQKLIRHHAAALKMEEKLITVDLTYTILKGKKEC